jgi:hypothetical protein
MDTIQTANFEVGFHEPETMTTSTGGCITSTMSTAVRFGSKVKSLSIMSIAGYLPKEVLDALEAIGFDVQRNETKSCKRTLGE